MRIDPFERTSIFVGGALLAFFLAAIIYANYALGIKLPTCLRDVEPFTKGSFIQTGPKSYELQAVARMWYFDLGTGSNEITIPRGSKLTIFITSADVMHGVKIPGKNVNIMAIPGVVGKVETKFDKAGEYLIVCHEYCGLGHQGMYGKIRVVEEVAKSM
ncbi:MAG: cytochrome c oxidase subunit II [Candidatus Methanosuratincola sp.]|jgi:cytochrome c oxidase subunit 2